MPVRMIGKEFLDFHGDESYWAPYPECSMDDEEILVNDKLLGDGWRLDQIQPTDKVVIVSGSVNWPGGGRTLERFFKDWRKTQSTTSFLVTCPKEDFTEIRDIVKTLGGKLLGGSN